MDGAHPAHALSRYQKAIQTIIVQAPVPVRRERIEKYVRGRLHRRICITYVPHICSTHFCSAVECLAARAHTRTLRLLEQQQPTESVMLLPRATISRFTLEGA